MDAPTETGTDQATEDDAEASGAAGGDAPTEAGAGEDPAPEGTCPPEPRIVLSEAEAPEPRGLRRLGFRYLHLIDAATLFGLMAAITAARFGLDWPTYPPSHYLAGFAVAVAIHMTVYYFGGLYEYEQRLGRPPWLPRAAVLTAVAVGIDGGVALLTDRYLMPRANLVVLLVGASLLVAFNRWAARSLRSRRFGRPRVLLVGIPDDIERARRHLRESDPDTQIAGQTSDLGGIASEVERVEATDVLLITGGSLGEIYPEPLGMLERRRIGVHRHITPADTLMGLQRTRQIAGMPFVALRARAVPRHRLRFKRLLDLAYLAVMAPVAVVLIGAVALFVRVRAGRGVLYRQVRVGHRGRPFVMLKFRTMMHGAEAAGGPVLAGRDDARVVPGLGWLRRARLDELPQLWNVAVGEMSIVGPRAERPERVASFEELIPGYSRRHDIPPGITGLAQTQGHYQTDPVYKLGHDLQYIVNWSPILDLELMAKSLAVMARRSGR